MKVVIQPAHTAVEVQSIADLMREIVAENEQQLQEAKAHLEVLQVQANDIKKGVVISTKSDSAALANGIGAYKVGIRALEDKIKADNAQIAQFEGN